jgi:MYXO-CTERM domain-containing protein
MRRFSLAPSLLSLAVLLNLTVASPAAAKSKQKGEDSAAAGARVLMPADHQVVSLYRLSPHQTRNIGAITSQYSVEGRFDNGDLKVYVQARKSADFLRMAPGAQLVEADVDKWMRDLPAQRFVGYEDYDEIHTLFEGYAADHPDFVKVMDYPWLKSDNGEDILILKISGKVEKENPKKPNIVITGSTHGDEWISTAVVLGIVENLINGYGSDADLTKFVDWESIYIMPVASPDSFHISREVHGVDPNRVFPTKANPNSVPPIESAKNIVRFYDELKPKGSLDYHAAQGSVMHPYGETTSGQEPCDIKASGSDLTWFSDTTAQMAQAAGYGIYGSICEQIYPATGGTVDAWYTLHQTLAVVIEVAGTKMPSQGEIPSRIEETSAATWVFLESLLPSEDPTGDDDDDDETSTGGDDDDDTTSGDDDDDTTSSDDDDDTTSSDDDDDSGDDDDDTTSGDDDDDSGDDDDDDTTSSDDDDDDDTESNVETGSDDDDDDTSNDDDDDDGEETESTKETGCSCTETRGSQGFGAAFLLLVAGAVARRRRK